MSEKDKKALNMGEFIFNEIVWKEERNSEGAKAFKEILNEVKQKNKKLGKTEKLYTRDDMGEFLFKDFDSVYEVKIKDRRPFEREMWAAVYNNDLDSYITAILAGANYSYRDKFGYTVGERARLLGYDEIAKYFDDPVDLAGGSRSSYEERTTNPYVIKLYKNAKKLKSEIWAWIDSLKLSPEAIRDLF